MVPIVFSCRFYIFSITTISGLPLDDINTKFFYLSISQCPVQCSSNRYPAFLNFLRIKTDVLWEYSHCNPMFCFCQCLDSDTTEPGFLKCVVKRDRLFKIITQRSLNAHIHRYTKKCRIEYLFYLGLGRPINLWSGYLNKGVKSNVDGSIILDINIEYIKTRDYFTEKTAIMVIALNVVNIVVFPFVTITLYVHVALTFACPYIRTEMRFAYLLFIVIFCQKVTELWVHIPFF